MIPLTTRPSTVVYLATPAETSPLGMAKTPSLRDRLGERVRELRRRKKLSLEKLAERAKLNDKFIQAVETGRQAPTIDTIEKLAHGLDVPVAELFAIEDQSPKAMRARARELVGSASDHDIARIVRLLEAALH